MLSRLLMRKGNGKINTMEDETAVYQAYMRENPPDPAKIQRGPEARERRRQRMIEAAAKRPTVRLDEEVAKELQQLMAEGLTYDQVVNQALREWLVAKEMKELVREELQHAFQQVISAGKESGGGAQPQFGD